MEELGPPNKTIMTYGRKKEGERERGVDLVTDKKAIRSQKKREREEEIGLLGP